MVYQLPTPAVDGSTYVVRFAFTDEDGNSTIPTALEWRMENRAGQVVNSRDWAVIAPGVTVDILLQGDDLYFDDGAERVVTVRGEYTSTLGTGLPLTAEARFSILDLQGIRR